jgi:GDP-mannose 6-dehydrogenase
MKINIFGLGYVGSVVTLKLVDMGHEVTGIEVVEKKVQALKKGQLSVFEPGLQELLALALQGKAKGKLTATSSLSIEDFKKTDGSVVCVGTPSLSSGEVDLSQLKETLKIIGKALRETSRWHSVILRSTVPPGTTEEVLIPILEAESQKRAGKDFGVGFYPEFLREGAAIKDFSSPSLNVLGCCDLKTYEFVHRTFLVKKKLRRVDIRTAEMIKYANNSFHALKVGFANEIGTLCMAYGVNSEELTDVFLSDQTLNISPYYLRPGFAFGGSCFPKELRAISSLFLKKGIEAPLISGIAPSNDEHISRLITLIQSTKFSKVGFLGVAFKPDTDDIRESPLLKAISSLAEIPSYKEAKTLRVCDSSLVLAKLKKDFSKTVKFCPSPVALFKDSELLILGPYRLGTDDFKRLMLFSGMIVDLKYFDVPQPIKKKAGYQVFC